MKVILTGGLGYIGSITAHCLLKMNHNIHIIDDLSSGLFDNLKTLENINNNNVAFSKIDILDVKNVEEVFSQYKPDAVIHLAALKSVPESFNDPIKYYEVNISGLLNIIKGMKISNCNNLVYSSSATVYGSTDIIPIKEDHPIAPKNVYGSTKAFGEKIIEDWVNSDPNVSSVILRYFNPVGSLSDGTLGESLENNSGGIMSQICRAANDKSLQLKIFGNDYNTADGTPERDFIHVHDLGEAHLAALDYCLNNKGVDEINIGTGKSISILELISTFEITTGNKLNYIFSDRRDGDIEKSLACPKKANKLLNWKAKKSIQEMCIDSWNSSNQFRK